MPPGRLTIPDVGKEHRGSSPPPMFQATVTENSFSPRDFAFRAFSSMTSGTVSNDDDDDDDDDDPDKGGTRKQEPHHSSRAVSDTPCRVALNKDLTKEPESDVSEGQVCKLQSEPLA